MDLLILISVGVIFLFGFVILFGAPYVPTLKKTKLEALDMLDLKPGQRLLELGSGDGRVLVAAARRGWRATGYELNPLLVVFSYFYTFKYRKNVKIIWGNFWLVKLPAADGIYVFLLSKYMDKLDKKIEQDCPRPLKLVSNAFMIPAKKPQKSSGSLSLYVYKQTNS